MTYLVTILLPDELKVVVERLQQQFQSPRWQITLPPHITFFYGTYEDEQKLVTTLHHLSHETAPFLIYIHGLDKFRRRDTCIYSIVEKSQSVSRLYEDLYDALSPDKKRAFVPHVTLSNRIPHQEAPSVFQALKRKGLAGSFLATELSLYRRDRSSEPWTCIRHFSLDHTQEEGV